MNLSNRFLIPTISLLIMGMGLSSYISYRQSRNALEKNIKSQMTLIADETGKHMSSWIEERKRETDEWSRVKVYGKSVQDSYMGRSAQAAAKVRLVALKKTYTFYNFLCIADYNGKIVASSETEKIGKNAKDERYFLETMKNESFISLTNASTGPPSIVVAAAIKNGQKNEGVLWGSINAAFLTDYFIKTISIGKSGYACLTDKQGGIISHPDSKNVGGNVSDIGFTQEIGSANGGFLSGTWKGKKLIAALQKIENPEWVLWIVANENEMLAPAAKSGYFALAISGAILLIIAVCISFLFKRDIVQPVNRVNDFAQRISKGEMIEKTALDRIALYSNRTDEIGMMTAAVENMSKRISDVVTETERLIHGVREGKLDIRGNVECFDGGWRNLISGINDVINAFAEPFKMTAEAIEGIATGHIPEKIARNYRGDFNEIKNNLNMLIDSMETISRIAFNIADGRLDIVDVRERSEQDHLMKALNMMTKQLNALLSETDSMIHAVREGDLGIRGNENAFEGGWRQLVQGLNLLIDAFSGPVNMTAECIAQISQGNIPPKITREYKGDFRHIRDNLNTLISVTDDVTEIAGEIAGGNLGVKVKKRSDRDKMMAALEDMMGYLQNVADVTERVSKKDLNVTVTPRSERDALNHSLRRMVDNLRQMMSDIEETVKTVEQQNWLKTGLADLGDVMRGEQDMADLGRNVITWLAEYLKAQIGAIYLTDKQGFSRPLGGYGCRIENDDLMKFNAGEGLVGQTALEKKPVLFSDIPDDYTRIRSGLGAVSPKYVLVFPLIYESETIGVGELGSVRKFGDLEMEFLDQAAKAIAIAFNTAHTRGQMADLLYETQEQAEELLMQREELSRANRELENRAEEHNGRV